MVPLARTKPSVNGRLTKEQIERSPERPETLPVDPAGLPDELKEVPQWVCWRWERRDGRWTKVPIDPKTGRKAKANAPETWASFDEALAYCRGQECDGIGFEFTADDHFAGVDLDDCRDLETGGLDPWAAEIVDEVRSYCEISPTGTGVKLFLRGDVPPGGNRKAKVEVYDRGRFFAVTGHKLDGSPARVLNRSKALKRLHARLFPAAAPPTPAPSANGKPSDLHDEEIIRRAKGAKNG